MPKRMNISSLKVRNWKPVLIIALLAAGFVWFLKTNTKLLEGMEDKTETDDKASTNDTVMNGTTKNGTAKTDKNKASSEKPMSGDDVKKMLSHKSS